MPLSVRVICMGAFFDCRSLRKAVLNEGLEALGVDEHSRKDTAHHGVFEKCALTSIRLPSTLKIIESSTFNDCKDLNSVQFPEGLQIVESI